MLSHGQSFATVNVMNSILLCSNVALILSRISIDKVASCCQDLLQCFDQGLRFLISFEIEFFACVIGKLPAKCTNHLCVWLDTGCPKKSPHKNRSIVLKLASTVNSKIKTSN